MISPVRRLAALVALAVVAKLTQKQQHPLKLLLLKLPPLKHLQLNNKYLEKIYSEITVCLERHTVILFFYPIPFLLASIC